MAGENKKWSQWALIEDTAIDASTSFPLLDTSTNYRIIWGDLTDTEGNRGLLLAIYKALHSSYTQISLTNNADNYINLGLATLYRGIVIEYTLERGTKYRSGRIDVTHNGSTAYASDMGVPGQEEVDQDYAKVAFSQAISSQIQIKITCDASDENVTNFNYRIVEKKPVAS